MLVRRIAAGWTAWSILAVGTATAASGASGARPVQVAPASEAAADTARRLRYELTTGDRLVYRETLEREVDNRRTYALSPPRESPYGTPYTARMRAEWTNHLLVVERDSSGAVIGVQRNRVDAELLDYRVEGRQRTAEFAGEGGPVDRALRGRRTAWANRLRADGLPRQPLDLEREVRSKAVWALLETPRLPSESVGVEDRWPGTAGLGLTYELTEWEDRPEGRCARIEGRGVESTLLSRPASLADTLEVVYWFCPEPGAVVRLEADLSFPGGLFQRFRERYVFRLVERHRGEGPVGWLDRPDTRLAVLEALDLARGTGIGAEELYQLLDEGDPEVRRRVLGLAYRWRFPPPPDGRLEALSQSPSPPVRKLAARLAAGSSRGDAGTRPGTSAETETTGASEGRTPGACTDPEAVLSRLTASRSEARQLPGTTLRPMRSEAFRGWPYAVRVPEDYRGDEPVPLLVYLAGNAGPAVEGFLVAEEAMDDTDYLVVYPHAGQAWWQPRARSMVDALLAEVMTEFNVDPERVFLTGLSNGGTGAYYFAALWPHRFSAVVSAMGAGQFGVYGAESERPVPGNLANVPMLFLHGARDRTIYVNNTHLTVELLEPRWAPLDVHVWPDRGHEITPGRGDDGRTLAWFRDHPGRRIPERVWFRAATLEAPRQYWVEILEKESGGSAEIHGRRENGVFELDVEGVRKMRLLLHPGLLPDVSGAPVVVRVNGREVHRGPVRLDCRLLERTYRSTGDPYLAYAAVVPIDLR